MMQVGQLIGLHVVASLLAAVLSVLLTARTLRAESRRVFAHHVVLTLFIPFLGPFFVLLFALATHFRAVTDEERPFATTSVPEFIRGPASRRIVLGPGGLRERLNQAKLPRELRLKTLLLTRTLPITLAIPLLREALNDPQDDIRLTAYGIYQREEKRLYVSIREEIEALGAVPDDQGRALHEKRLAQLYWELVYQAYAHIPTLRTYALDQAKQYAQWALARTPDDAELWLLLARIALAREELKLAAQAIARAAQELPPMRFLSHLAELAFLERNFTSVQAIVTKLGMEPWAIRDHTWPVYAFWMDRPR